MDALPPELIELIIQQCDFASLKHLRLVAKPFEHIATPLVFRDFYAAFFAYSLDNIGHVANSRVREHVKSLTIYTDFLPDWVQDEWRDEVDYRPGFPLWAATRKKEMMADCFAYHLTIAEIDASLQGAEVSFCQKCLGHIEGLGNEYGEKFPPRPDLTTERLDEAWTRYCRLKDEQWYGLTEDVHGIMLKEHLSRLPNLESVAVKPATAPEEEIKNLPVWKSLAKKILVSPKSWMQIAGPGLHDVFDGESVYNPEFLSSPLQWALEAVGHRAQFSGTKQVKRLDLVHNDLTPLKEVIRAAAEASCNSNNPLAQGVRFQTVVEAFSHVQDLSFQFPHAGEGEEVYGRQFRDEASEFLHAAKNLEILKIRYPDDELGDRSTTRRQIDLSGHFADLESNLDAFQWPHLTSLSLSTNVKADPFLSFLAAHSTTLRSLTLFEMDLGDVRKVLSAVPSVLPGLTDVHVEGVFDLRQGAPGPEDPDGVWAHYLIEGTSHQDAYEQDVKRYLLGQREELPLLYDENWMNASDSDESEDESEEQSSETFDLDEDFQS
ncbi:hypothetical protein KC318_g9925 [Hortaea werneckii]|nr:hypothetical protein KC334_g10125 [Hortaea werneckii]KAI7186613.1 hypothetical protein KC324_g7107 [Hortaea werneckii]KAI7581322.1 hypothetical protein KC316_g8500 [Hortaea werneckii]KAI7660688.1 hypothetical protein KC318_g9925 [Hortaea werneckii]